MGPSYNCLDAFRIRMRRVPSSYPRKYIEKRLLAAHCPVRVDVTGESWLVNSSGNAIEYRSRAAAGRLQIGFSAFPQEVRGLTSMIRKEGSSGIE